MKNERRFPRVRTNAAFCLLGREGATKGKTKNISPVGVFVRTNRTFPVGERVYINVHLPRDHGLLVSQAEVVWICPKDEPCGDTGLGLKFIDLGRLDLFRLENYVRQWQESQRGEI
ncbi:MAG: PilZ domain-containing protein [Syntrophobacteria bacterium]